jgi:hypothetical protein
MALVNKKGRENFTNQRVIFLFYSLMDEEKIYISPTSQEKEEESEEEEETEEDPELNAENDEWNDEWSEEME